MVEFCNENSTYILFFHKFMIGVKDIKSQVGWANQHRSLLLKKRDIEDQRQVLSPWSGGKAP